MKRLRNSATFPKNSSSCFVSVTQRCSDNEVFCAEPEPGLTSNLPTESEWEDPLQRKGTTTFKVVPSKKQKSHDAELSQNIPDQFILDNNPESTGSPELCKNQTETEDNTGSPDRSETETHLQSPEPSSQEMQASEGPASPPPPLDLDHQDGSGSPLSEARDTVEKQEEEDEPEVSSQVIPATQSDCSDEELPSDGQIKSEDQSELPQSPSRQSLSADVDHCDSSTEEEVEKLVQEDEVEEEKQEEDDSFPPPPSPVFFNEDIEVTEEGREETAASSLPSSQPPSPTSNGQTFSEDHQNEPTSASPDQPSAAPKPLDRMSSAPSRFAQAVALAVQRSRLQRHGKVGGPQAPGGPHNSLASPPKTIYQFGESQ